MPISDYSLGTEIGRGGFGAVHVAQRVRDGRTVAVKVLRLANDENLRRFNREAKMLRKQVHNQHVVDLLDWDIDADPAYIVMEYCQGGSLRKWVGRQMDWRQVCFALSHAADGLTGIHAAGGFHRDIKPDNLLVADRGTGMQVVKVADFGLARIPDLVSSGPMTRSAWGTDGYIAPELARGFEFDQSCDVFSLGVTGIELLTGSRSPTALSQRPDTPPELRQLLLSMVHPDRASRPTVDACHLAVRRIAVGVAPPNPAPVQAAPPQYKAPAPAAPNNGGGGVPWLAGLAALVGAAALATMNTKDDNGRFRDAQGKFRSGRW